MGNTPWTLRERFPLHILLDLYGYDHFKDVDTWWPIYEEVIPDHRTLKVCQGDHRSKHLGGRSVMYKQRIIKNPKKYDDDEREAYERAHRDIIRAAKKLGIALPKIDKVALDGQKSETPPATRSRGIPVPIAMATRQKAQSPMVLVDPSEEVITLSTLANERRKAGRPKKQSAPDEAPALPANNGVRRGPGRPKKAAAATVANTLGNGGKPQRGRPKKKATDEIAAADRPYSGLLHPSANKGTENEASLSEIADQEMAALRDLEEQQDAEIEDANDLPTQPFVEIAELQEAPTELAKRPRPESSDPPVVSKKIKTEEYEEPTPFHSGMSTPEEHRSMRAREAAAQQLDSNANPVPPLQTHREVPPALSVEKTLEAADRLLASFVTPLEPSPTQVDGPPTPGAVYHDLDSIQAPFVYHDLSSIQAPLQPSPAEAVVAQAPAIKKKHGVLPVPEHAAAYDLWRRTNLDRILLGPAYDIKPTTPKIPGYLPLPEAPLSSQDRIFNFFSNMFDGKLEENFVSHVIRARFPSENPGQQLEQIFDALCTRGRMTFVFPRYQLTEVFSSDLSPFSNFRLATAAFGRGVQMLHQKDLDFLGLGETQLIACARFGPRHFTADDIKFIDHEDAVFKRGGRVHNLYVRQQECAILGESDRYNSAYVCMDVMLCRKEYCDECSGEGGHQELATRLPPRVHRRNINGNGDFSAPLLKVIRRYELDEKCDGRFMVDVNHGLERVKFWDGTTQDVFVCYRLECQGCQEAAGARF